MGVLERPTVTIHLNDYVDPDGPLIYSTPLFVAFLVAIGVFIAVFAVAELLGAKSPGTWAAVLVVGTVLGLIFFWPN